LPVRTTYLQNYDKQKKLAIGGPQEELRGEMYFHPELRGYIQKFPDWPPGARTANDTALCKYVQLYRYFVSQSSEFCRHNPLLCFSMWVYWCQCCLFRCRLSPKIFGYNLV